MTKPKIVGFDFLRVLGLIFVFLTHTYIYLGFKTIIPLGARAVELF